MRLLVLLVLLAGCAAPAPQPACLDFRFETGVTEVCVDDLPRTLSLHVPDEPDGTLILVLHGAGSWGARMEQQTGVHVVAPRAIVAYPEGTALGETGLLQTWNGMHCCGPAHQDDVDDVGFLQTLIEAIEAEAGPQRVLLAGHSNGAMMAYRFASERPGLVDGVAAVAGTLGGRPGATPLDQQLKLPAQPVPVLIIHGLADEQVPYDGGMGARAGGRQDASVLDAVTFWRQANNASILADAEIGASTVERYTVERYTGAAPVTVVTTPGGHSWPRNSPDASPLIVEWFYAL